MELRDIIKEYRKENGLSMQEFSEKSGLSKGYISMLESGKHPNNKRALVPSLETYKKLASAMGMALDDLLKAVDGDTVVSLEKQKYPMEIQFFAEKEQEDELPEITLIARAGKKMSPDQRELMLRWAKMSFPEAFKDDD